MSLTFPFRPYRPERHAPQVMLERAEQFFHEMDARRSVRNFSPEPVPRVLIEWAVRTASTAPSGAHRQPWTFVAVGDPELKRQIRLAAETEERQSYEGGRMPDDWLEALAPLGTDWHKEYLEIVPWIVVVFEALHGHQADGRIRKNYYTKESVGMACGLFSAALHHMGLCTLTHTPSPMGFLGRLLGRPNHERPYSFPSATRPRTARCRTCAARGWTKWRSGTRLVCGWRSSPAMEPSIFVALALDEAS